MVERIVDSTKTMNRHRREYSPLRRRLVGLDDIRVEVTVTPRDFSVIAERADTIRQWIVEYCTNKCRENNIDSIARSKTGIDIVYENNTNCATKTDLNINYIPSYSMLLAKYFNKFHNIPKVIYFAHTNDDNRDESVSSGSDYCHSHGCGTFIATSCETILYLHFNENEIAKIIRASYAIPSQRIVVENEFLSIRKDDPINFLDHCTYAALSIAMSIENCLFNDLKKISYDYTIGEILFFNKNKDRFNQASTTIATDNNVASAKLIKTKFTTNAKTSIPFL